MRQNLKQVGKLRPKGRIGAIFGRARQSVRAGLRLWSLANSAVLFYHAFAPQRGRRIQSLRAFRRAINLLISLGLLSFRGGDGVDVNFDALVSEGPADFNISKHF